MLNEKVTACITHFERPRALTRLMKSLKKFYPNLPYLVDHTGGNLSASRNRLSERCKTPYYLMLEEDFEFTPHTKIEDFLTVIEGDPKLGGVGGNSFEPKTDFGAGRGKKIWWDKDFFRINNKVFLNNPSEPKYRTKRVSHQPCDIILNWGLFRNQLFKDIPWAEHLPIHEHTDFFWRAYLDARWDFTFCEHVELLHYRDRPSKVYNKHRRRNFTNKMLNTIGVEFVNQDGRDRLHTPNVVFLSVGRANSSITTKMMSKMFGLHTGEILEKYWENSDVVKINQKYWDTNEFDLLEAHRAIRKLPQPWIIKDPRFRRTLNLWKPVFRRFNPLLVYVTKDINTIKDSYQKQNWNNKFVERDIANCEAMFSEWSGPKIKLGAENIADAISYFDQNRISHNREVEGVLKIDPPKVKSVARP